MSNEVRIVKTKSNAPWILGLIGFVIQLPAYLCAVLCASVATGAVAIEGGASAETTAAAMGTASIVTTWLVLAPAIVAFILSFFGKSKASIVTGVILLIASVLSIVGNIMVFNFLGLVSSILFMCAGISSICNHKKVAA